MRRTLLLALVLTLPASADVFRVLEDPRDAAQARVDLIEQAQREIDAAYFMARNDRVALTMLRLLREARRRGVEHVRLVVDAYSLHVSQGVLAHLIEEGVEIRVYHPITLRHPTWIFHRMHEKVVIADSARYIAGGRNLAEAYFGMAKRNFVDRDVYVDGISAAEAQRHFDELWSSDDVAEVHARASEKAKQRGAALLDQSSLSFVKFDTGNDWSAGQKEVPFTRFLNDTFQPSEGARVGDCLVDMLDSAESSIIIESPYVVPSQPMIALLEKKLAEGLHVQIVTNSIHSSDGVLPYAGFLKYRRRLVLHGADVREYKGPDTLHAKTLVIDGRTVLVGSYNFDPRSHNLDAEVMCLVDDPSIAGEVRKLIDAHLENAWTITAHEHRIRIPRMWRIRAWAARMLLPLYERQL